MGSSETGAESNSRGIAFVRKINPNPSLIRMIFAKKYKCNKNAAFLQLIMFTQRTATKQLCSEVVFYLAQRICAIFIAQDKWRL